MKQQIHTFQEVFPHLNEGGVYFAEDLHTSYWKRFGGKYKSPHTFIEYAKELIDEMHAWHAEDKKRHKVTNNTRTIDCMHVYDSIFVFDKKIREVPRPKKTGKKTVNQ